MWQLHLPKAQEHASWTFQRNSWEEKKARHFPPTAGHSLTCWENPSRGGELILLIIWRLPGWAGYAAGQLGCSCSCSWAGSWSYARPHLIWSKASSRCVLMLKEGGGSTIMLLRNPALPKSGLFCLIKLPQFAKNFLYRDSDFYQNFLYRDSLCSEILVRSKKFLISRIFLILRFLISRFDCTCKVQTLLATAVALPTAAPALGRAAGVSGNFLGGCVCVEEKWVKHAFLWVNFFLLLVVWVAHSFPPVLGDEPLAAGHPVRVVGFRACRRRCVCS